MLDSFVLYCDESSEKGKYYSHFYGGALVRWSDRQALEEELRAKKAELDIGSEVKWTRISEPFADRYIEFMNYYFDQIEKGRIKTRIMFTQNINVGPDLPEDKIENEYFLLYYQFVKHAFGLRYWNHGDQARAATVHIYLDDPPQNSSKFENFKKYMSNLSDYPVFTRAKVSILRDNIAGVSSKEHTIMQGLDVILGGVQSRLNELHTKTHPPAKRRSKRARAKERVYKAMKDRMFAMYPHFNVGASTGIVELTDRWEHPHRHWCFVPTGSTMDRSRGKKG